MLMVSWRQKWAFIKGHIVSREEDRLPDYCYALQACIMLTEFKALYFKLFFKEEKKKNSSVLYVKAYCTLIY